MRPILLAAVAVALAAGPVQAQKIGSVPRVEPSASAPRGDVLEWTTPEGQEYWYRLPKSASARKKPSLVIMLHGTGLNHGWAFWNYPIGTGQFRGDDIVVSPDGLTPGQGDTFNFLQGKKDGDQIANLIALFHERFDLANVYLYGHSQGAFFCYWFAGEHPELVDGIVAHAGNVLDVKHPKLAKEKVAIGILHTTSDQVVPVECAHRSEKIYREQGYQKLKCWIVEGIREQAGHWPLPDHVATMFEWLDEVSTKGPGDAAAVALSALSRDEPDFVTAARLANEARAGFAKYRGDDKEAVAEQLALVEGTLAAVADAVWAEIEPALAEHDGGSEAGPWAADVRWARRELGAVPRFEERSKPLHAAFKKHDKAFDKPERVKDKESKAFARALVNALEDGWLAARWDEAHATATSSAAAGVAPFADSAQLLGELATTAGAAPRPELLERVRAVLAERLAEASGPPDE